MKISNPEPTYNETTKKYEDYLSAYFGGVHTSQYGTPQQSDTGAALTVGSDGKHYIFGDGETEKWYYKENTWYNVVYSVNKDGISYSFLDEKTGEEIAQGLGEDLVEGLLGFDGFIAGRNVAAHVRDKHPDLFGK